MIDRVNFTLPFRAIPILLVDVESLPALCLLVDKLFHQLLKEGNLIILIFNLFIHVVYEPLETFVVFLKRGLLLLFDLLMFAHFFIKSFEFIDALDCLFI